MERNWPDLRFFAEVSSIPAKKVRSEANEEKPAEIGENSGPGIEPEQAEKMICTFSTGVYYLGSSGRISWLTQLSQHVVDSIAAVAIAPGQDSYLTSR